MNIEQLLTKLKALIYSKSETDSLLGGKANSSHTHTKSQITDFPSYGNTAGTICQGNDARLSDARTPTSHTHTKSQITDFPSLATVATSGSYTDLSNKPTIPSKVSQLSNDSSFITSSGSCSYSTTSGTSTYSTYLKSLGSQTPKSGRDIFHSGVYTYTTYTDTNTPAHYGAVIGYGNGQGGSCEMFAEWVGRGNLWFRVLRDCDDSWTNWQRIITSDNIGSQSVNYANSAGSAGSVAWGNVSGKPSTFTPSSHTHDDRYYTESEINTKLSSKSDTSHNHNSTYLGISAKAESAKVADYAKLLAYSHTNEINFKGGRQATCYFNYRNADDDSIGTAATVEYKFCNYGGNSVSNVTVSAGTFKENGSSLADKYQAKGSYASSSHTHTKSQITDFPTIPSKTSQLTNDSGFITSTVASLELKSSKPYIDFHGSNSSQDYTSRIIDDGNNTGKLRLVAYYNSANYQVELYKNYFEPTVDNDIYLGDSTNRWKNIFCATDSISTSDLRLKNTITDIDDSLLDAWENIEPKQYKFNDATEEKGDKARYHTGYLAQDIQAECEKQGVNASDYGLFCYDEWDEQEEVSEEIEKEKDGKIVKEKRIIQPKREKGDRYSLRYAEALVVECKYLRRENSRLKENLASIEERLEKLEKAENS